MYNEIYQRRCRIAELETQNENKNLNRAFDQRPNLASKTDSAIQTVQASTNSAAAQTGASAQSRPFSEAEKGLHIQEQSSVMNPVVKMPAPISAVSNNVSSSQKQAENSYK